MGNEIFVTKATLPPFDEYINEIRDIWETHWLTNMGQKHNELERILCEKLDVPALSLFCNGHMALELAIQSFDLDGEVITTPFTFASTTHAIVRNGLSPVFCDINSDDYTIDVSKIEGLITEKTSAIIPVHVYGNVCDVEEIDKIAKKHNLKVIYDAAHAFGVEYKDRGIANYGDASMFSFHATKVFNTIEGGAIVYKDERIGKELYKLKNFGIKNEEEVTAVGANAKMNEFSAAMGICNIRHFDDSVEKRKQIAEIYDSELKGIKGLHISNKQPNVKTNYAYYPIWIDKDLCGCSRDYLHGRLCEAGIFTRKYFYPLVSEYECYRDCYNVNSTPNAERIAEGILTLPIYEYLEHNTVLEICKAIKDIVKN